MLPLRLSDVGWRQEWICTANKKEKENGGNTQYLERRVFFFQKYFLQSFKVYGNGTCLERHNVRKMIADLFQRKEVLFKTWEIPTCLSGVITIQANFRNLIRMYGTSQDLA